jgi:aminoglycoside phosphotransferase (APT) family kinase protein
VSVEPTKGEDDYVTEVQRSSRDPEQVRQRLERWLGDILGPGSRPVVSAVEGTSTTGMSSETLLFSAAWTADSTRHDERLVARLAPDAADVPVFPEYDLEKQFRAIRTVSELTSVPVPRARWCETDAGPLGTPFFVMDRVDGVVPPDIMPYNFGDNWLFDASSEEQRRLQDSTVGVLAELHGITPAEEHFDFLAVDGPGDTPLRRRVGNTAAWYEFARARGGRSPLVERTFAWLDDNWPSQESAPVLVWGDARIGNVMYRDFTPVGIFDWEMAALGPRELDLTWLVYAHCVFQDIAATYGLGGMPAFLRYEDVAGSYERLTGHTPRDLEWFAVYSAVQYAIVFLRTGARSVHFGEREMPEDVDDLILNREPLERMLAGSYWI